MALKEATAKNEIFLDFFSKMYIILFIADFQNSSFMILITQLPTAMC